MTKFREELQTMVSEDRNAAVHDMLLVLRDLGVVEEFHSRFTLGDRLGLLDEGDAEKLIEHARKDSYRAIIERAGTGGFVHKCHDSSGGEDIFWYTLMAVKPQKTLTSGE